MKTLPIVWQRLVTREGRTCPRCHATHDEVLRAMERLGAVLAPLGVAPALETRELDISSGGGAVQVKITGSGKFLALKLDPEFLKEDAKLVEETVLNAIREAATKAKELNDSEMQRISSGFQMPGMF